MTLLIVFSSPQKIKCTTRFGNRLDYFHIFLQFGFFSAFYPYKI